MAEMTIISSHRPHVDSGEYAANQIRAKESWNPLFDAIYYFGPHEQDLESPPDSLTHTHFVECEPWPHTRDMAKFASEQSGPYVVISNADIVITEGFKRVVEVMGNMGIEAATTRRRDLGTKNFLPNAGGYDIWVMQPSWWNCIAEESPKTHRIGHGHWDAWILMFLRRNTARGVGDFSAVPCVFHPEHGDRNQPFQDIEWQGDAFSRADIRIVP